MKFYAFNSGNVHYRHHCCLLLPVLNFFFWGKYHNFESVRAFSQKTVFNHFTRLRKTDIGIYNLINITSRKKRIWHCQCEHPVYLGILLTYVRSTSVVFFPNILHLGRIATITITPSVPGSIPARGRYLIKDKYFPSGLGCTRKSEICSPFLFIWTVQLRRKVGVKESLYRYTIPTLINNELRLK